MTRRRCSCHCKHGGRQRTEHRSHGIKAVRVDVDFSRPFPIANSMILAESAGMPSAHGMFRGNARNNKKVKRSHCADWYSDRWIVCCTCDSLNEGSRCSVASLPEMWYYPSSLVVSLSYCLSAACSDTQHVARRQRRRQNAPAKRNAASEKRRKVTFHPSAKRHDGRLYTYPLPDL